MSERVKIILDKNADILRLPAIALRGPGGVPADNVVHFEVGRQKSIAAIEWLPCTPTATLSFLTAQQDMDDRGAHGSEDLYAYGVVAGGLSRCCVSPDELVKVLVEGKYRAKLLDAGFNGRSAGV